MARALRRYRLDDFRGRRRTSITRPAISNQLAIAMRGELAYRGARRWERQGALWSAAEVTMDADLWEGVRRA
ncbi:MAG: hypothetical protein R2705_25325 [Ilumatobacteraceae bacterium]